MKGHLSSCRPPAAAAVFAARAILVLQRAATSCQLQIQNKWFTRPLLWPIGVRVAVSRADTLVRTYIFIDITNFQIGSSDKQKITLHSLWGAVKARTEYRIAECKSGKTHPRNFGSHPTIKSCMLLFRGGACQTVGAALTACIQILEDRII